MKDNFLHIRITSEEKQDLEKSAKIKGFDSISAYVLFLIRTNNPAHISAQPST
jgi:hypothetical protein